MRFSTEKSREFADSVLYTDYFLEYAADWIAANLSPDRSTLEIWALNNSYKLDHE